MTTTERAKVNIDTTRLAYRTIVFAAKPTKCQGYEKKITVVVGPALDISTAMIPTSKLFSE